MTNNIANFGVLSDSLHVGVTVGPIPYLCNNSKFTLRLHHFVSECKSWNKKLPLYIPMEYS